MIILLRTPPYTRCKNYDQLLQIGVGLILFVSVLPLKAVVVLVFFSVRWQFSSYNQSHFSVVQNVTKKTRFLRQSLLHSVETKTNSSNTTSSVYFITRYRFTFLLFLNGFVFAITGHLFHSITMWQICASSILVAPRAAFFVPIGDRHTIFQQQTPLHG